MSEKIFIDAPSTAAASAAASSLFSSSTETNKGSEHNENVDASRPVGQSASHAHLTRSSMNYGQILCHHHRHQHHLLCCHPNFVSRRIVRNVTHSDIPSMVWRVGWGVSVCLHWNLWPQLRFSGHSKGDSLFPILSLTSAKDTALSNA